MRSGVPDFESQEAPVVYASRRLLGSFCKLIQPCQDHRAGQPLLSPGPGRSEALCGISEKQQRERTFMRVPFSAQENSSSVVVQELSCGRVQPASWPCTEEFVTCFYCNLFHLMGLLEQPRLRREVESHVCGAEDAVETSLDIRYFEQGSGKCLLS